jgi:ectoine hydroxylase-related dioxygenase (phytanoyl-CoA dioxygenase family)
MDLGTNPTRTRIETGMEALRVLDGRFYAEHGYAVLEPGFPPALIEAARADVRKILDAQKSRPAVAGSASGYAAAGTRKAYRETASDLHLKSDAVRDLVSHDALHALSLALIGPEADLRFCFTLTKSADHGEPLDWHQDWGLDQDQGHHRISLWLALTDADISNGCVQTLPGSHKEPLREHAVSETHPPDRGIRGGLDASDLKRAVPVEMKAGQLMVIHPQVIHGSGRNHSGRDRIALLFSYQIPKQSYDARWAGAGMRFSVRGEKKWEPLAVAP